MENIYKADNIIIGGGVAGLMCSLELLDHNKSVLLIDKDEIKNLGGQGKESFGGVFICDSPTQRKNKIKDSKELALSDWLSFAEYEQDEDYENSLNWAKMFIDRSVEDLYYGLHKYDIGFFPVVHWVERGMLHKGNSVPRFHMIWGTGKELTDKLISAINSHKNKDKFTLLTQHGVDSLIYENKKVTGCYGKTVTIDHVQDFKAIGENTIIASGGVCANLDLVRKNWHKDSFNAPKTLLIGCHKYADGLLHKEVEKIGGKIINLDKMWNYAAGIEHPRKKAPYGLSLVPPKSALWMDAKGRRIGPLPLVTAYDTRFLVQQVCKTDYPHSWHILNYKIALKELAASGSESNENFREKKFLKVILSVLFGNKKFVHEMIENSSQVFTANSIDELLSVMEKNNDGIELDKAGLVEDVEKYDATIDKGKAFFNDEQLRLIESARNYRGDKARTCKFQKIFDPNAKPYIAIKLNILVRKSLGGIKTNLNSKVLDSEGNTIDGLYAIGESAGFGGGGMHGKRTLEGTFLGGCVVSAKAAARGILNLQN